MVRSFVDFPAGAVGTVDGWTSKRQRRRVPGAIMIGLVIALILPLLPMVTHDASAQGWSAPRTVYIPETGHTLDQVFLDVWREGGGASAYGYPVTAEFTLDDGTIIQYLQYARFEWHPNGDANGNKFVFGKIGEELRPFSLQRSVASFSSGSSITRNIATTAVTGFASAWLPVEQSAVMSNSVRYVEETGHTIRYGFRDFWESTGEEAYLGYPITEEYVVNGITYQVFERGQLAWKNGEDPWLMPIGETLARKYQLNLSPEPQGNIPTYSEELFVPPAPVPPPDGERWIEVNLSTQYLIAWQGDVSVNETYISSGRAGFDTPTGTFYINTKLKSDDMEGVLGGEYYNVPAVPNVMYFTNRGHAIHGTYWHNNFGTPMSHGCINVPEGTAAWLYDWASIGTRVVIHY